MLRALPEQVASPVRAASVQLRPRVARTAPVFIAPQAHTVAVRGQVRNGSAAALIAEPTGVCVVSADRSGRRRVRRFTIPEVLSVEEHRSGQSSELVLVTATTVLAVTDVDIAQGWAFCREVRSLILGSRGKAGAGGSR
jgi:hypothetical protein